MSLLRMDNVLIVVDDLEAATAFFVEIGMELEGEAAVEGLWVNRVVGLDDARQNVAMLRTPDGHGRLELTKFHNPTALSAEPKNAPVNTLGIRRSCSPSKTSTRSLPACAATAPNWWASWSSTRTAIGSVKSAGPKAHY